MTTPTLTPPAATAAAALEARVIILETQLAATMPTLATKSDIAEIKTDLVRLEGRMEATHERQEGKMEAILPGLATKADLAQQEGKMEAMHERQESKMEAILPGLATKADLAQLEGKMEAMYERQDGKINRLEEKVDAMGNRMLIRFTIIGLGLATLVVAAIKYLP